MHEITPEETKLLRELLTRELGASAQKKLEARAEYRADIAAAYERREATCRRLLSEVIQPGERLHIASEEATRA